MSFIDRKLFFGQGIVEGKAFLTIKRELPVNRAEKQSFIESFRLSLEGKSLAVVTRQSGLTVAEVTALRAKMREAGATYKVVKNTLARIAVNDTPMANLADYFVGAVAIAASEDAVAAAKVVMNFAKTNNKIEIVAGSLDGEFLDVQAVKALAELPSLDELRAKLIGLLQAPLSKIIRTIKEPAACVARVCSAYGSKNS